MAPAARVRAIADGEVQGVGYRYYVARAARRFQLAGRAANMEDGRVEIIVEGDEERLQDFVKAVEVAGPPIKVHRMEVIQEKPTGEFKGFKIVTGELVDEVIEGFSTGASYFNVVFEKQDLKLSKIDQMLDKQDKMIARQDEMIAKQDEMIMQIRDLRNDLRSILQERFAEIEREISEIKSKIGLA